MSQHAANTGHKPPDINNFDILTTVNGTTKHRKILEALYIVSQQAANTGHKPPDINNFDILTTVNGTTKHRKILEALYIKNLRPSLNIPGASVPLTLL